MRHPKIAASLMALFTTHSYAASFEPLGQRTLGDVYDNLMTIDEMNQYIDDQGKSNVIVDDNDYDDDGEVFRTRHTLNNPHELSDVIDTSVLDMFDSWRDISGIRKRHVILIKGDVDKYSWALLTQLSYFGGGYLHRFIVYNKGIELNDDDTGHNGRPYNISIRDNAANP